MPEVMFKVVALGFPGTARQGRCQGMVIFVFDFPACSSNLGKVNNIYSSDCVIDYEAVLIQDFTCSFLRDDQFQPINLQSIAAIAQGNLIGKTILLNFAMLAIPMPLCDFFYTIVLVQESDPLIQAWVRLGFAGKDEKLVIGFDNQLAQRLIGIQIIAQVSHSMVRKMPMLLRQPALCGYAFTILLLATILRNNKLRWQGQNL